MDDHEEKYVDDCCQYCKSFSLPNFRMKKGYCMKMRRFTKRNDLCGYFKPDIKVEYQIECRATPKQINTTMPSKFRN